MPKLFAFVRFDNDPSRPLSKQEHTRWKILAWCYTALWVSMGISVKFFLPVSTLIKVPIYVLLVVAAPTLVDLFGSYNSYLKRREKRAPK